MKFDYIIGNPPYQEDAKGEKKSKDSIYNYFMDESYKLSDHVELIHPARFLFNAGSTPKSWNEKMLSDEDLKVLKYYIKGSDVFPNTDIKGGVAITYHENKANFGAIKVFIPQKELKSIWNKVVKRNDFKTISDFIYAPESYKFTQKIHEENPWVAERLSDGHLHDITTNIFKKIPELLFDEKPGDDDYVGLIGLNSEKTREKKWVKKKYVVDPGNLNYYKVILPQANGSGAIGEVLSTPLIGQPLIGHTQTFISIGKFETEEEANACLKYIKTKFARALLGVLKITQVNKKGVWQYVPLQDFTSSSDIDWSESVDGIDKQLYKKYGLDDKEIEFIESHVEAME